MSNASGEYKFNRHVIVPIKATMDYRKGAMILEYYAHESDHDELMQVLYVGGGALNTAKIIDNTVEPRTIDIAHGIGLPGKFTLHSIEVVARPGKMAELPHTVAQSLQSFEAHWRRTDNDQYDIMLDGLTKAYNEKAPSGVERAALLPRR